MVLFKSSVAMACAAACACGAADPDLNALLLGKIVDSLACGCLIGLLRAGLRLTAVNDPATLLIAKLTWKRFLFDVKVGLVSGLLLGSAAVAAAIVA